MNEETLNLSIRKFLKVVGISSQREIEKAVAKAMEDGLIKGGESFRQHDVGGAGTELAGEVRR